MAGNTRPACGHLAHPALMDLVKMVIRRFDDWLSHVEGVEPFAREPLIILRLQYARAGREIRLPDGLIAVRAPVLILHFWNERLPAMTSQGADLAWALQFQRRLLYSMKAVALHLRKTDPEGEVAAVGGVVAQVSMETADGGRLLLERLGFTIFPYRRPAGAFGEFWENFYTWMLMWTYNPGSLRSHSLLGLQRNEFWMTRARFLDRFAGV